MIHERAERNPQSMFGKPVFKGTRITAEHISQKLSAGTTVDPILTDHSHLTVEDVYAAVAFAADYL